jgi:CubicO group peptidase (beta-lactamase class C family)
VKLDIKSNTLNKKLIHTLICAVVFMGSFQAIAQETDSLSKSEQVNKLFECTINAAVPGASVIVIHRGKILHKKGYGLANIEQNKPNTPETIFRLGSMTKQFTAIAILQLYDKGMLQIDEYVEKYLPGTLNGGKITIKHLLTHTSGISESLDSELAFTPGDQISYSNTGYNLLGKIIEKVSGISYEDYLQRNIFKPLGMDNTGYEHPNIKIKNSAVGYKISDNGSYTDTGESDISGAYAAGALYSTIEDMYRWDQALYTEKLIKTGTLNQAFSQMILNDGSKAKYGFGWMVNQLRGLLEVGHGGDITGFNSYIARYPEEQFTVIVLSNVEMRPPGPLPNAGDLAHKIAEIFLSDKMGASKEAQHVAIVLDSQIIEKYLGQYKWVNASKSWIETGGEFFTIIKKNNQLFIQAKTAEIEIFAETETLFFMKDNSIIKFIKENERVTELVFDAMGLGVVIVHGQKLN